MAAYTAAGAGPRIHCTRALASGLAFLLPAAAARHVQVLRMQPGQPLTLFDGQGGEYAATIARMGRGEVAVEVGTHAATERELARAVHLAVGMPANERMDWLVEKATELGAASIWPLAAARSVLKLTGERAEKKRAHWEGIAIAACEQCGRNRLPVVHAIQPLPGWLEGLGNQASARWLLSPAGRTRSAGEAAGGMQPLIVLSGPEGGFAPEEERAALQRGFTALSLGPRILRAETAPLAVLAALAVAL